MSIQHIPRILFLAVILVCATQRVGLARPIDEKDPILETQTRVVPVTADTLNNDKKPGAPAPSYKMTNDTSDFLVSEPMESVEEEKTEKEKTAELPSDSDGEVSKDDSEEDSEAPESDANSDSNSY